MKSNVEIIRETLEQIVNQKRIETWDDYFNPDYIARTAPSIGLGLSIDCSGDMHVARFIVPGSPAEGKLQIDDEVHGQRMTNSVGTPSKASHRAYRATMAVVSS